MILNIVLIVFAIALLMVLVRVNTPRRRSSPAVIAQNRVTAVLEARSLITRLTYSVSDPDGFTMLMRIHHRLFEQLRSSSQEILNS